MRELFFAFFKLGWTAFGGPAAHIGLMETEFVEKRKWLSRQQFLDLIGFTNLIPGPNSSELAIAVGYVKGGFKGMMLAGIGFIFPAFLIVLALAMAYVYFGDVTWMEGIFKSIMPVIMAVIATALYRFSKSFLTSPVSLVIAIAALVASLLGISELPILLGGAFVMLAYAQVKTLKAIEPISLSIIFFGFLKIGAFLYGTGYVLLSFLQTTFVVPGLISGQQLIDAVAVGQFTPGPLFTTASFLGYLMNGIPGAVVATISIFLPSFLFILILMPQMHRLRQSKLLSTLLDGINSASLGLMAAVTFILAKTHLNHWLAVLVAIAALGILIKTKINATWLIGLAALVGVIQAII